jgi:anti-anti-sigma regulatory factor
MPAKPYQFRPNIEGVILNISGGICKGSAADFSRDLVQEAARFGEPEVEVHLDFDELDLLDGTAVAETVNAIRNLLETGRSLRIVHAPQMLAHTLYKTGMLEDGRIILIDPVEEESTAN